jgi:hypothetical protein
MTHSVRCFLCKGNEAELADTCEECKYRIERMERQIESEEESATSAPLRSWAKREVQEWRERAKRLATAGVE